MSENAQWYLLQTKARDEQRALDNLHNQGVHTYCPTIEVNKIVRGKRQLVTEVLFPGYIFVQLDDQSPSFTSVRSTRGVSKFVSFGSSPAVVPNELIRLVQQQCDQEAPRADKNTPKTGDIIEITDGAFKGLQAVFSQPDGAMRAIVLVTVMSQQVPVSLPNRDMTKVGS